MWCAFLVRCTVSITYGAFVRSVSRFVFVWDQRAVFTVSRDILVLQRWEGCRMEGLLMCWGSLRF